MNGRAFADTNVFIYLYSEDEIKKQKIAPRAVNEPPRPEWRGIRPHCE
jgi:predicted nucleic acid-binding protein